MQKSLVCRLLAGFSLFAVAYSSAPATAQVDDFPDDDPSWARTEFMVPSEANGATKGFNTQPARKQDWPFFAAIWLGLVAAVFTTALRLWRVLRDGVDLGEFDGIDESLLEDQK